MFLSVVTPVARKWNTGGKTRLTKKRINMFIPNPTALSQKARYCGKTEKIESLTYTRLGSNCLFQVNCLETGMHFSRRNKTTDPDWP